MWDTFLYQHIVGGIIFISAFVLYYKKTDKDLIKAQGNKIVLYPVTAFVFYFLLNLVWTYWAIKTGSK